MTTDQILYKQAKRAWEDAASFRSRRRRLKAFAYGKQWDDTIVTSDGRRLTEAQRAIEEGRTPITNNIIRRMIKCILGRYSRLTAAEHQSPNDHGRETTPFSPITERDSRALEELLISGSTIQYVDRETGVIDNISPDRFLFRRFARTDASDCTLLGVLRDWPLDDVLLRFSDRSPHRAAKIRALYHGHDSTVTPVPFLSAATSTDFTQPMLPGTVRVIEVWKRRAVELLRVHDPLSAEYKMIDAHRLDLLTRLNARRKSRGLPELSITYDIARAWVCTMLSPNGTVLDTFTADNHPFAVRFYPMIDGEVHSAVEDVVDQQKLINRLVSTLDQIIASSAKGVLLYPADQLPDGFTWRDVRRIWSNPSGILPFKRTSRNLTPQQVNHSANSSGATELLRTQLEIFDEIAGATASFRGRSAGSYGEGVLRAEMENALTSMLDILNTFHEFIKQRDKLTTLKSVA